ncbi:MAG: carbohydrate ABC transporter substrate-binding protein [Lachnospiraceae bacterium]|nr:carbohydrate ABC transporter substrate-binding protein [Lachnospiraceae bacterium]
MKIKRILALVLSLAMVMTMFAACGKKEEEKPNDPVTQDKNLAQKGSVYMLNFKPEQDGAFKKAAEAFEKETGIKVKIETAASGEYETTLKTRMTSKDEAPTLFTINGPVGYNAWKEYCADLTEVDLAKMVTDQGFLVKDGDKVFGIANCVEGYGIIYNNGIIKEYCAMDGAKIKDVSEITSFETLKAVVEDMDAKKADLGIDAVFASTTLESSDNWRWVTHLNNMPLWLQFDKDGTTGTVDEFAFDFADAYKNIFDLYINYDIKAERDKTTDDAMVQLATGRCVFAQNGTWAWGTISGTEGNVVKAEDCGFLPIYTGSNDDKTGVCAGTENFFSVNAKSTKEDQAATIEFLKWLYTSEAGMDIVKNDLQFIAPFNNFKAEESVNPLINALAKATADGKVTPWKFHVIPSENFKQLFGANLKGYAEGSIEWSTVVEEYSADWATEMSLLNK